MNHVRVRPRGSRYGQPKIESIIWASWLPRFLVGDVTCEWAIWHMCNFNYTKMPDDDMSEYLRRHADLVRSVRDERERRGYQVSVEDQNRFKVRFKGGIDLVGIPDLVAEAQDHAVVVDAKGGQYRDRDAEQVKLYMACLPNAVPHYRSLPLHGEVVYGSGHRVSIDASERWRE